MFYKLYKIMFLSEIYNILADPPGFAQGIKLTKSSVWNTFLMTLCPVLELHVYNFLELHGATYL